MANITGASLAPIYERLNGVPEYHPLEAQTFADWSIEAGDIVTVTRDDTDYESPVHSTKMVWKKTQQVSVSTTGNEKRDSISKISSRKYNSGSSAIRNSQYQHIYVEDIYRQLKAGLELTSSSACLYVDNKYLQLRAGLELTSSYAALYVDNKYLQMQAGLKLTSSSAALYVDNKYLQMRAGLYLTSSSAHLYVDNKYAQMTAGLNLTSSSAHLYVDSKYLQMQSGLALTTSSAAMYVNGKTSKAQLLLSINGAGHSTAYLEAENITLDGATKMTDTLTIEDGGLRVKKAATFLADVTLTGVGGTVHSTNYQLFSNGKISFNASSQGGSSVDVGYTDFDNMIVKAAVSGNVLKLWKRGEDQSQDPALTFSKATSVSGSWSGSGNNQKYLVAATQGQTVIDSRSIGFGGSPTVLLTLGTNGTPVAVTGNKKAVSAPVHVYTLESSGGGTQTVDRYTTNLTINSTVSYNYGKDDGKDELTDSINRIAIPTPATEDNGYYTCTVRNTSNSTIKTLNAHYDSDTPSHSTGVRVPLLVATGNNKITTNGDHSPSSDYLGYKTINVAVAASLNACNYVNSTQNLPSGTKINVTDDVRSVITNNWRTPGVIYWRFNVGGTYYVFYTNTQGP